LKVQFFWPFKGKYWIIDLADDYSYAVISQPKQKIFMDTFKDIKNGRSIYQQIISRLEEKGFDLSKLQATVQP
jgi:apolipoprotein D and lipocalin family protein